MINKQGLWFITLFSLILILGVYYITMPDDALTVFSGNTEDASTTIEVTDSDILVAMKVEQEEQMLSKIEDAQKVLLDNSSSIQDKNLAYESLQLLNMQKGKSLEIEKLLKEKFNIDSCIKIDGNKINVILSGKDQGVKYANDIINEIQKLYDVQMYITVKFQ